MRSIRFLVRSAALTLLSFNAFSKTNWGATSLTLGAAGEASAVYIDRFLPAAGVGSATPTSARIWWNDEALTVEFHCVEPNPRYRGNPALARPADFPTAKRFQLRAFPDLVMVLFRPDWKSETYFSFAVDSMGGTQSERFSPAGTVPQSAASLHRDQQGWIAQLHILGTRSAASPRKPLA